MRDIYTKNIQYCMLLFCTVIVCESQLIIVYTNYIVHGIFTSHGFLIKGVSFSSGIESSNLNPIGSYLNLYDL